MNKNVLIIAAIIIVAIGGFVLLNNNSTEENGNKAQNENILAFKIGSETKPCVGIVPRDCMIVNGEFFYDTIEGFIFEPGFEYELRVERTERENVPADASKYEYKLIEVVSKTPA